jgi:Fic family protein
MDLDALRDSPVGQLVPISGTDAIHGDFDYFAFLPSPLGSVHLSEAAWSAVSAADNSLGALRQATAHLPNPGLLVRPAIVREAVSTSELEGTFAPLREVISSHLEVGEPSSREVMEIRAYEEIARDAIAQVEEGHPISIGMLERMQGVLARASAVPSRDLGQIRQHQVFIGPEGRPIAEARFVPPPGDDRLRAGVEQWLDWMRGAEHLPPPLQAALAHYQFETLHPFGDGNGRLGPPRTPSAPRRRSG